MSKRNGIESLGLEIQAILERFYLPSNEFNLTLCLSTLTHNRISIKWQHDSQVKEEPYIPKIDFSIFDEQIYSLLKSYNCEVKSYGMLIGIPYQIFDAYAKNFPDQLSDPDAIDKTGSRKDATFYYVLMRKQTVEVNQ